MKIFVISLAQSLERRSSISQQFDAVGLDFSFFDAIDGRSAPHPLFDKQDLVLRKKFAGIPLLPGELGCFASHYLLWEKCCQLNSPIIIIEDDAELKDNFATVYAQLPALAEKHEYFRLFENDVTVRKRVKVDALDEPKVDVVRYLKGPASTRAYLLGPTAAKKFLLHAQTWHKPVDTQMDEFWLNDVQCKGLVPGIVKDETQFDSEIKETIDGYKNRSLKAKAVREYLRTKGDILSYIYNVKLGRSR